jgi:hypothetical protein
MNNRQRGREAMSKKLITRITLLVTFAAAAVAFSAVPAAATPTNSSPGACNMLHTAYNGYLGMVGSGDGPGKGQGLANMMDLVISSEEAGCAL